MLTLYEAALAAQNPLARGIFKSIVTEDWMFSFLPFVPKDGDSFSYARECVLPAVEWLAPGATTTESAGYDQTIVVPKYEMSSDFDVQRFVVANQSATSANNPVARAIARKAKAAGRDLSRVLIRGKYATGVALGSSSNPFAALANITPGPFLNSTRQGPGEIRYTDSGTTWEFRAPGDPDFGDPVTVASDTTGVRLSSINSDKYITVDVTVASATADGRTSFEITSTSNEPDGLNTLISPAQTIGPEGSNGTPVSFTLLDTMIDMLKSRNNPAFIMNAPVRREVKDLLRAAGGNTAEMLQIPGFSPRTGEMANQPILSYEGIPILKNEFILPNESHGANSDLSSIYLVDFDSDMGFYLGVFGGSSVTLDVDPRSRPALGFELVDVGPVQTKNANRMRINFYGGSALGADIAAVRAKNVMQADATANP